MNIFDLQATISLNGDSFMSGVEQAKGAFEGLEGAVSAKAVAIGNILADMAANAAGKLADFAKSAIDTGMGFDASMSNVKAISGATAEEFDELRAKAKEMGASTKFTATEAADAFSYMAMAGWKTEDMLDGIEGIMNLAAASGENLASTSDIVTDALTAFGLTAADSGRFADVLAAASSNANTNVGMMGETFKYVAPVAGALGYSIDDMATAIGTMANSGIKGSQAGTALRSALSRMVKPTKQVYTALGALNLTFEDEAGNEYNRVIQDANGNMIPFSETVNVLREAFSGLSEAETAEYAAMLFGQEAMSGMLAIINSAPEDYNALADAIANASEAAEGQGTAFEMAQTQLDNLSGRVTLFQSAFDGLKVAIYDSFSEPLSQAVDMATGAVEAMTRGFGDAGLAGAISNLGAYISDTFSGMISSIDLSTTAVGEFFGAFAAGDPGLIDSAAEGIQRFSDALGDAGAEDIMGRISQGVRDLFGAFASGSADIIATLAEKVSGFLDGFSDSGAIEAIAGASASVGDFLGTFLTVSGEVIEAVARGADRFLSAFDEYEVGEILGKVAAGAADLFDAFADVTGDAIADIGTGFETFFNSFDHEGLAEGITAVAGACADLFAKFTSSLAEDVRSVGEKFSGFGETIGEIAAKSPADMGALGEAIADLISNMTEFAEKFNDLLEPVREFFSTTIGALIETAVGWFVGGFGDMVDAISSAIEGFNKFGDAVLDVLNGDIPGAFESVKGAFRSFAEFWANAWHSLVNSWTGARDAFRGIGENLVNGLKEGFTSAWESFKATVSKLTSGITDFVKGIFGVHSPSRVFAGIGENLVRGMEKGWGSEFGDLERLVGSDLSSLTGTARIGFESSAVGRSSAAQINTMLMAGQGSSSGPISINLILDGDVAATALYDPLRRVAWQKDHSEAAYA